MYWCQDALGGGAVWIYFFTLIVFGSFFILNLVLGVISAEFAKEGTRARRTQRWQQYRKDLLADNEYARSVIVTAYVA